MQDSLGNNQIEFVGDRETLKHKHPDDQDLPVERNLRPCKQVDYRLLDDPLLLYDPSLELTALANDNPEEESWIDVTNGVMSAIIEHANLASEDPHL